MPDWLRLSIAGSATLLVGMGLGRFSYSPLIPALIEDGILNASEAGIVGASNFAGYLAGALAAPLLKRTFGEVRTVRIALVTAFLCLAGSALPFGFFWLAACRALVGACVGVMMIYAVSLVTRATPPGRLGTATGIVFAGVGLGILFAGLLVPLLLETGLIAAWSGIAAIGCLAVGIAFWGWRPADGLPSPEDRRRLPRIRWSPLVLGFIGARTLFALGLIPHSIYWVDFLVRGLGNDIHFGGFHWILFGIGAIAGTFLWGMLADRIGFRAGLVLAFAVLAIGVALPALYATGSVLVFSSLAVGAQPGVTAILAGRVHQLMGPEGMTVIWRRSALVSTVVQAVASYGYVLLFDYTEDYTKIFLAGGAAMALGALISLTLSAPAATPRR